MREVQIYNDWPFRMPLKAVVEIDRGRVSLGTQRKYFKGDKYYPRRGFFTMTPEQAHELGALLQEAAQEIKKSNLT